MLLTMYGLEVDIELALTVLPTVDVDAAVTVDGVGSDNDDDIEDAVDVIEPVEDEIVLQVVLVENVLCEDDVDSVEGPLEDVEVEL
mmetsp:Transcript_28974/g.64103  ORF Transcript_28974/g.64103 Transcript_28974/m.64103 type:complete len:86 (+) Transcript_28974:273-530(+)